MNKNRDQVMPTNSVLGKPAQNPFRGNVNLDKFDDRVDPDAAVLHSKPGYIRPMPTHKTGDEIDRLYRYNQMMGRNPMGYIFS